VERLHVRYLRDLICGLRSGASQREVARDLGLARMTVQKDAQLAAAAGYLDPARPLPAAGELAAALGPAPEPPRASSSVEPFRAIDEQLVAEGVEMMTIYDGCASRGTATGAATRRSAASSVSCARMRPAR
jgi:hypothetical protein